MLNTGGIQARSFTGELGHYPDILKEALGVQKRSTRGAYKRGYEAGYADSLKNPKFSLGNCSKCGKALHWNLTREKDVELLTEAINRARYFHSKCSLPTQVSREKK